jgi:hydroxymethylglutaryl-CoA lyase
MRAKHGTAIDPDRVKLIECPRDAWQALPQIIPAEIKAEYLRNLVLTGFRHIDAVSFVSPRAVPQMADSEQVLQDLDPLLDEMPDELEIIGIVVNTQGADRAIATGMVNTLGFPYSISPTFLERNQRQAPEEAIDALDDVYQQAYRAGLDVVAYISMAFGNPYGDDWNADEVIEACRLIADLGIEQISLADTVGVASPEAIESLLGAVYAADIGVEIGAHLHARREHASEKIAAAYHAGCRRFDTAIAGMGGCPFAQDALVGNVPTEVAIETLSGLGAKLPDLQPLRTLITASQGIAARFGTMSPEVVH